MTDIAPWVKEYVGIPFLSGGRTREGADCYGLIRMVLTEKLNKKLPLLSGDYSDADNLKETERVMKARRPVFAGREVETPAAGDVCVIRFCGRPVHLGIYSGGGYLLHTLRQTGSVLQKTDDPLLSGRVEGWYHVD
ncbi:MAG: C40 family peptidase [Treponema sp.]|jgi:cell wall-associated NlpC family hydrolase|nr:C40 family peptidase [Treponema sp.]